MKIRNKMAIALRMARKNLLVSVILFWIGLICFSLFGRMWTEYRNSGRWIAEYQKIQNFDADKMQYLECTRFLTQDYELDNTVIGTMMDELRALDGVSWFGTYQYNGLNFEEFQQESYLSYARAHGSRESDEFLRAGYARTMWIYGDAWDFCKIRMIDGSDIAIPQEDADGNIPVIAGYQFRELLHEGDLLHHENKTYRVVGILASGSRYLINGAHKGSGGCINLDWALMVGTSPEYYSGSYNNFRESMYFQIEDGSSPEEVENQILNVLDRYEYHGWCESVADMTRKIQQENDEYTQHQRILCVLIVLITICSLGIISLLEIQNSKYAIGVWGLCGISPKETQEILAMRYAVMAMLACAVSATIEGIRAYRRASIGNYGAVVVNLEWKLFFSETVWVVVICAIAVLAVIFLMCRFLLKDKLIMELMAEKEVS